MKAEQMNDEIAWGGSGLPHKLADAVRQHKATVALIVALVAVIVVLSANRSESRPASAGPIRVVNENSISFSVTGAVGGEVDVRYLQAGRASNTIWMTVIVIGLSRGLDYMVTAGSCTGGAPQVFAISSGLPDPATDVLVLPVDNVPGSQATVSWIRIATASGVPLGGVRGQFWAPHRETPIAPEGSACS